MEDGVHLSFCRQCMNCCALKVTVEAGHVTHVTGDRSNPLYAGYSCIKGRVQPDLLTHPERLLRAQKRGPDGHLHPIATKVAIAEIAERLLHVRDEHGPQAIASYWGMMLNTSPANKIMLDAFSDALGVSMRFTPITIDKPGKRTARALHGWWMAPWQGFDRPDVILMLGMNPLVSHQGFPLGNPSLWLKNAQQQGLDLIVIDPRQSETARRAALHIQPKPGYDIAILAALIRILIAEDLYDHDFVRRHVGGIEQLAAAVEPFQAGPVADAAGIDANALTDIARRFGAGRRGYAIAGTGPHMAGDGTLVEYLVLALDALCGHYLRAGERVKNPGTLSPAFSAIAQAHSPEAVYTGQRMPGSGRAISVAGPPVACAPAAMTTDQPGRIRALLSVGGNPVAAWPDQKATIKGLDALDLFVQIDPWMSQSSAMADYVIAPTMALEVPSFTNSVESQSAYAPGYGAARAYGQFSPAIVAPPAGSDVIEEWRFFFELARHMALTLKPSLQVWDTTLGAIDLEMDSPPESEALLDLLTQGARVALGTVKAAPHGGFFDDPPVTVAAAHDGWNGKLDVGNLQMMEALAPHTQRLLNDDAQSDSLRLLCRRMRHIYNSSGNIDAANRGQHWNPAFMNPQDMQRLGIAEGAAVVIDTAKGQMITRAMSDPGLRPGTLSVAHAFGAQDAGQEDDSTGGNSNRLLSISDTLEMITGQAPMSNIAVRVAALDAMACGSG